VIHPQGIGGKQPLCRLANHFMCLETWNHFTANITIFRKSSHYYIPDPNSFILSKSCWTIKRTRYL